VDWALTLFLEHPLGEFALCVENSFAFRSTTGTEVRMDPGRAPTGLGPVLACARTSVAEAVAYADGRLEVAFADGSAIKARGSPDCESWNLTGPHGLLVVSIPGGDLAIWGAVESGS
jgi:hypothetical protein